MAFQYNNPPLVPPYLGGPNDPASSDFAFFPNISNPLEFPQNNKNKMAGNNRIDGENKDEMHQSPTSSSMTYEKRERNRREKRSGMDRRELTTTASSSASNNNNEKMREEVEAAAALMNQELVALQNGPPTAAGHPHHPHHHHPHHHGPPPPPPHQAAAAAAGGLPPPPSNAAAAAANMWSGMIGYHPTMVGMNVLMDPMSMNNYGMIPSMMAAAAAAAAAAATTGTAGSGPAPAAQPQPQPDASGMIAVPDAATAVAAAAAANAMLLNGNGGSNNGNNSNNGAISTNVVKEIIHCKSCTLFPPNPNAPPPTTRERPHGCRTVFVGGLPENMTEEIITEVFERCGEITTLRLSKKNFCHIRFVYQQSVDSAIFLSGYRIRIGSNSDPANAGRLHVDYAQARDDQYEWECRQRQLQREQRHRERMEEERLRPPSPPPVVHYTDHEATSVSEKIKQDETFAKAVQIVITWLERGDCSKRNANTFYSMIQSTNSHVRRLLSEKSQYEEELQKAKEIMKGRMQGILLQFSQIERLFVAACHKKVWDHFTKAQRKNIESWKKQSMEIKNVQLDEHNSVSTTTATGSTGATTERADDEMDVSDEDQEQQHQSSKKRNKLDGAGGGAGGATDERVSLREENNSLRCQVEAYKNEVEVIKMEYKKELEDKDKQFKLLKQTLQGMQQQLMETRRRQAEEENKVRDLQNKLTGFYDGNNNNSKQKKMLTKRKKYDDKEPSSIVDLDDDDDDEENDVSEKIGTISTTLANDSPVGNANEHPSTASSSLSSSSAASGASSSSSSTAVVQSTTVTTTPSSLTDRDARLVGIIGAFLNVHPFGAGLDYIWSYVSKLEANARPSDIELLMTKFPSVFKQELIGIGADIERRWLFNAFVTHGSENTNGNRKRTADAVD